MTTSRLPTIAEVRAELAQQKAMETIGKLGLRNPFGDRPWP